MPGVHGDRDGRAGGPGRGEQGRRVGGGPGGGDTGGQADGRSHPPVPSAPGGFGVRQLHHRRHLDRDRGPGRDGRPHRRGDGGADRLFGGGTDHLRHVQVGRPGHENR